MHQQLAPPNPAVERDSHKLRLWFPPLRSDRPSLPRYGITQGRSYWVADKYGALWRCIKGRPVSIVFLTILSLSTFTHADTLVGRVIEIEDGNTLTIYTNDSREYTVKLAEIEAPEFEQEFGNISTASLAAMCLSSSVEVTYSGQIRQRGLVGNVKCDGLDINRWLVMKGLAWVAPSPVHRGELFTLQEHAKKAQLGLWQFPDPIPPWEWRQNRK